MNAIIKCTMLGMLLFLGLNSAIAQGEKDIPRKKMHSPEQRAAQRTDRMTKVLSLTPDQQNQIMAINTKYAEKVKALRSDGSDREANKEAWKQMRTEKQSEVKSVLNKEQIAKLETQKVNYKKRRHANKGEVGQHKRRGGKGKHRSLSPEERATKSTARLTEALSLSPDQAAKVKYISLKYGAEMKALRADGERSEEKKKAFKMLKAEKRSAINAVLNAEQLKKYEELKFQKKGKHLRGTSKS